MDFSMEQSLALLNPLCHTAKGRDSGFAGTKSSLRP
jgi:hypothetical protein